MKQHVTVKCLFPINLHFPGGKTLREGCWLAVLWPLDHLAISYVTAERLECQSENKQHPEEQQDEALQSLC